MGEMDGVSELAKTARTGNDQYYSLRSNYRRCDDHHGGCSNCLLRGVILIQLSWDVENHGHG